jgi:hypothetical protein
MINAAFNKSDVPGKWRTLIVVPIPKKGDLSLPTNYRGISLMCIIAKIYNKALLFRVRKVLDGRLCDIQNGFRPGRSTIPHIVTLREILRFCLARNDMTLVAVFIDYTKAFDSVKWDQLKAILIAYRLPIKLVNGIMSLYRGASARVRTSDGLTDVILLCRGVLQGDTFAPYLFVIIMDFIIRKVEEELGQEEAGFTFPGSDLLLVPVTGTRESVRELAKQSMLAERADRLGKRFLGTLFADDAAMLGGGVRELVEVLQQCQRFLAVFERTGSTVGLEINVTKTEVLVVTKGKQVTKNSVLRLLSEEELKVVRDFNFLGSYLGSELADMRRRLKRGWDVVRRLAKFWRDPDVRAEVKILFFGSICRTVFLYSSPTWVLDAKMEAALNGCYTRMLRFAKGLDWAAHPTIGDIYGEMPTVVALIAQRRLAMISTAFQREKEVEQPMTRIMWELAARRQAERKIWASKSSRNIVDQLFEDLARVGRGHLNFGEVVSLMQKPKLWDRIAKEIINSYPPAAPLAVVAGRVARKARQAAPAEDDEPGWLPLTPLVIRSPSPMRSSRRASVKRARQLAKTERKQSASSRLREALVLEYIDTAGAGRESFEGIFLSVQGTEVPSRARKGYWPLMEDLDAVD